MTEETIIEEPQEDTGNNRAPKAPEMPIIEFTTFQILATEDEEPIKEGEEDESTEKTTK